jgi:hypothetical protein
MISPPSPAISGSAALRRHDRLLVRHCGDPDCALLPGCNSSAIWPLRLFSRERSRTPRYDYVFGFPLPPTNFMQVPAGT